MKRCLCQLIKDEDTIDVTMPISLNTCHVTGTFTKMTSNYDHFSIRSLHVHLFTINVQLQIHTLQPIMLEILVLFDCLFQRQQNIFLPLVISAAYAAHGIVNSIDEACTLQLI